ncbi:hypothetical protein DCC39_08285 [Pueribacillus theae]|uniref:Uncharacterized protein n=1 Tax=Pueribacillus theae TaxID=2171751 RepID=A0A2U1K315_9BACI|nr:DUF5957 family protein [Pueribacillus theae]PWA11927.1 hypothetical protein DCC39_08285 [Pueribacillus theae]
MQLVLAVFTGAIGDFILGIVLSGFIGVFGMFLFDEPIGIKFLPYFTAFLCAIVVPIWTNKKIPKSFNHKGCQALLTVLFLN